ncbi:MAG: response regulator [Thiohalocapsa sp. PB-PSB1]|jgi:CheY-like chemotaxis protein|nr:MAG: response regulator [Thiohalocapsa sp. PB-PSB1]QQO54423.1 MAG: response regulator [Thiohalocapsa sp. PB-PSB1]HCS92434.1 response regulator [Chromatiaceae bacterium]
MKDLAALISAFASLLWPVILAAVLYVLRPAVLELVSTAKNRKFSIKVGGQELTMDEANEQQQRLIADLQAQVIDLRNRISPELPDTENRSENVRATIAATPGEHEVLWVDDNPKNNSYLIEQLLQGGIKVRTVLSTSDGARMLKDGRYAMIVSDMGRNEVGGFNPHAGLDFLKLVRGADKDVPFVLFTNSRSYQEYRDTALSLGATYITSSTTDLAGIFRNAFGKRF